MSNEDETTSFCPKLNLLIQLSKLSPDANDLTHYMSLATVIFKQLFTIDCYQLILKNSSTDSLYCEFSSNSAYPNILDSPIKAIIFDLISENSEYLGTINKHANHLQDLLNNHWLMCPLIDSKKQCFGVLAFANGSDLDEESQLFLEHYSKEISTSVEKFHFFSTIDSYEKLSTNYFKTATIELQKTEKLKQSLIEMTSLASKKTPLNDLYKNVDKVLIDILSITNLGIMRYDPDKGQITFAYIRDKELIDPLIGQTVPFGSGMNALVINNKKAYFLNQELTQLHINNGDITNIIGTQHFVSWLAAPLISGDDIYGVICTQTYENDSIIFQQEDLEILCFIANNVATAIKMSLQTEESTAYQIEIEQQYSELKRKNLTLSATLKDLHSTEQELIKNQKMTSLASLVSGVAYKVNEPIKSCVDYAYQLDKLDSKFVNEYGNQLLTEQKIYQHLDNLDKLGESLCTEMEHIASLVLRFKEISIESSLDSIKQINLHDFINHVIKTSSLDSTANQHKFELNCSNVINLKTNTEALYKIFLNLILNSINHGFSEGMIGKISINCKEDSNNVFVIFSDNGIGVNSYDLNKLFEPFYCPQKKEGLGLGTNLIYNLIVSVLNGTVKATSPKSRGLTFDISIPKNQYLTTTKK